MYHMASIDSIFCSIETQNELLFKPSVSVEFVTQMGVQVPEFVASAVEMHTSLYHESEFNAKLAVEANQVKLTIPAARGPAKLLSIR